MVGLRLGICSLQQSQSLAHSRSLRNSLFYEQIIVLFAVFTSNLPSNLNEHKTKVQLD